MSGEGEQQPGEPPLVFQEPPPLPAQDLSPKLIIWEFPSTSCSVFSSFLFSLRWLFWSRWLLSSRWLFWSRWSSTSFVHQESPSLGLSPLMCKLIAEQSWWLLWCKLCRHWQRWWRGRWRWWQASIACAGSWSMAGEEESQTRTFKLRFNFLWDNALQRWWCW